MARSAILYWITFAAAFGAGFAVGMQARWHALT
jgi:hypothetical protein